MAREYGLAGFLRDTSTIAILDDGAGNRTLSAKVTATGGSVARTQADWFVGLGREQEVPPNKGFYTTDSNGDVTAAGVNLWLIRDRMFVGDAAVYRGAETKAVMQGSTVYSGTTYAIDEGDVHYLERDATFHASSPEGSIGILGSSATSRRSGLFDSTRQRTAIAIAGYVRNDADDEAESAWAGYFEGVVDHDNVLNTRGCYGLEIAIKDKRSGGGAAPSPYTGVGSLSQGIWLAGGGGTNGGAAGGPSSVGIKIGQNTEQWKMGICIDATGIEGTDGETGTGTAIGMAKGHMLEWYLSSTEIGAQLYSDVDTEASQVKLIMRNNQFRFQCTDQIIAQIEGVSTHANYFRWQTAAANSAPALQAGGSDTDIGVSLRPKGAGVVDIPSGGLQVGVGLTIVHFTDTVTLDTGDAETDVGLTPNGVILHAAIRVSTAIAGLDSADHHIQLGINGASDRYVDVANGSAATSIAVNVKDHYVGDPATNGPETSALVLTVTGGSDNTPSAGAVEVEVIYIAHTDLADV